MQYVALIAKWNALVRTKYEGDPSYEFGDRAAPSESAGR